MNVAIIPARGGSKRIPRKNIRDFCGKPIIAYSIEAAQKSSLFDRIIVSTDDMEIAEIALKYNAEVPFMRPKELADDYTGTNAVVKHAIKWLKAQGSQIEFVCCIYATAPFVSAELLRKGVKILVSSGKDFAISVTTYSFPIQRSLHLTSDGSLEPIWPENMSKRSQDLEETYHDAGQFYWGRPEAFLNETSGIPKTPVPIVLPRYLVQDIDTFEDWKRAELMFSACGFTNNSGHCDP